MGVRLQLEMSSREVENRIRKFHLMLQRNRSTSPLRLVLSDNHQHLANLQIPEAEVALVRHLASVKDQIRLDNQRAQRRLREHSALPQPLVRGLPLDSPPQEDLVNRRPWEPNQILLDNQQHRQVHLVSQQQHQQGRSDSHPHLVREARSASLLVVLKRVHSARQHKRTKHSRRLSRKVHSKEGQRLVKLQRLASRQLLVSSRTMLLGSLLV